MEEIFLMLMLLMASTATATAVTSMSSGVLAAMSVAIVVAVAKEVAVVVAGAASTGAGDAGPPITPRFVLVLVVNEKLEAVSTVPLLDHVCLFNDTSLHAPETSDKRCEKVFFSFLLL